MNRHLKAPLTVATLLLLLGALPVRADSFQEMLDGIRVKHGVVALGGALVTRSGAREWGVSGLRRTGSPEQVERDDLWHLGSCTKSMTATLLARHAERGTLRLDQPLPELAPEFLRGIHPGYRAVTLDLLLRNRGGAPTDLSADGLWTRLWQHTGSAFDARALLATEVMARVPAVTPGEQFLYSNAGFAIAGHILERREKKPWEELMARDLFEPLGMKRFGFGAPGSILEGKATQPCGHRIVGGQAQVVLPGPASDNPVAIGPAGIVHCSLEDWARYVALHLEEKKDGLLLRAESVRMLHQPRKGEDYALGWVETRRPWGGRILTHSGSNTMWFCVAWLAPEKGFAVLATCNQGGEAAAQACDAVAGALIQRHLANGKAR